MNKNNFFNDFLRKIVIFLSFFVAIFPFSNYSTSLLFLILGAFIIFGTDLIFYSKRIKYSKKFTIFVYLLCFLGSILYGFSTYITFFAPWIHNQKTESNILDIIYLILPFSNEYKVSISIISIAIISILSIPCSIIMLKLPSIINKLNYPICREKVSPKYFNFTVLFVSFSAITFFILSNAYFFNVNLTPDSHSYLREAQILIDGHGMHMDYEAGFKDSWFTWWPIGYPALIAATSFIFQVPVILGSIILSIIIIFIIFILLYNYFKEKSWIFSLIFTTPFCLSLFSSTWSEQPFILGLILFCFIMNDIIKHNNPSFLQYLTLTASALLVFLSRYIGFFIIGIFFIYMCYTLYLYIKKKEKSTLSKFINLSICSFITGTICCSYLIMNLLKCGFATGLDRGPALENFIVLSRNIVRSLFLEAQNILYFPCRTFIFPFFILLLCYFILKYRLRINPISKIIATNLLSFTFTIVGIIYLFIIIYSRCTTHFDNMNFRFLQPSTILIAIALLSYFIKYPIVEKIQKKLCSQKSYLIILSSIILIYTISPIEYYKQIKKNQSYSQLETQILTRYKNIPSGCYVLGGHCAAISIRPDLIMLYENLATAILKPCSTIYVDMNMDGTWCYMGMNSKNIHPLIRKYLSISQENGKNQIIYLSED
ncbi:MAG: hypothetical protein RSE01_03945 [Akkermansia sp.]